MKPNYTANNTITWPAAANGLANGGAVQSTTVNNTSDLALDDIVCVRPKTGSGTIGSNPVVNIYVFGSNDNTTFSDGLGATAAAYTMPAIPNFAFLMSISCAAVSTLYVKLSAIANAFGGTIPPYWGLVAVNATGVSLDATTGITTTYEVVQTQ
jgi:hypothetical protein